MIVSGGRILNRDGLLIGLDVGTTGARAIAIDLSGAVVAAEAAEYPMATPRPGWTEQDPEDWWAASRLVLGRVASRLREPVLGLGLTGQMHGAVFLDDADRVIRPALLWNDQRTSSQCRSITEKVGAERLIEIAGNPALTGFQAPKLLWLREEEPASHARVRRLLLPKDFIRLRLTGEAATDASDASGTLFLDLRARDWSAEILDALEVPRDWLPRVYEGPEVTGVISGRAAKETGLPPGLPVAAGGGDNAAAAIGSGIISEGLISSSIGSSGVIFAPTDILRIEREGRLHSFCHAVPGGYHLMGVTLAAGAALRWWRDVIGGGTDYEGLVSSAAEAPPGSEGLIFLPYLAGERTPHLDPLARGAFLGLSLRHSQAHLTRAVMEGVAFSLKDSLDLVSGLGVAVTEVRATGGGARSALWRQLLADVFGVSVHRTTADEGPAQGAALLAGVASGAFADVAEACSTIKLSNEVSEPLLELHDLYSEYHEQYVRLYSAARPVMHRLTDLADKLT
jgi:xylulokinase